MPAKKGLSKTDKVAKKATKKAARLAKKAQAKQLGRNREVLNTSEASSALKAALKLERRAAKVKPRDADTPTDDDATVIEAWQDISTLGDDKLQQEIGEWVANPTG